MYALIRNGYFSRHGQYKEDFDEQKRKESLAGTWQEVDISFLSDNQYDIAGIRFFDDEILEIKDDARIGLARCSYCGSVVKSGETCKKHEDCKDHKLEDFSNCFFIKHKGKPVFQSINFPEGKEEINLDKKRWCYLQKCKNTPFYYVGGSNFHQKIAIIDNDIYVADMGYRLIKHGGRDCWPYIPKYVVEKLHKMIKKQYENNGGN